jgi:hypothetical protein
MRTCTPLSQKTFTRLVWLESEDRNSKKKEKLNEKKTRKIEKEKKMIFVFINF